MKTRLNVEFSDHSGNHSLQVVLPETNHEKKLAYHYRYLVYKQKGLIEENQEEIDIDKHDKNGCDQFLAILDGNIVGSLRMIQGDVIPMRDIYFDIKSPNVVKDVPKDKIFEISRIISTPYEIDKQVPRHLVILTLFYCCLLISRERNMQVVVGIIKERILQKLAQIEMPLIKVDDYRLDYDPYANHDPLALYFDEGKTGKICPIYAKRENIENYFHSLYENRFIFEKLAEGHLKLKSFLRLNLFMAYHYLHAKSHLKF